MDFNKFFIFLLVHLPSPTNLIHPTIDLTCFCKKDRDIIVIIIFSPFLITDDFSIVRIGDFAPQDDALNAEKS